VRGVPVPIKIPPHVPEYQFHDPFVPDEPPEILKTEEAPVQIFAGLAEA
jgi:hypothetical protein